MLHDHPGIKIELHALHVLLVPFPSLGMLYAEESAAFSDPKKADSAGEVADRSCEACSRWRNAASVSAEGRLLEF